jgi:hypothetical protein
VIGLRNKDRAIERTLRRSDELVDAGKYAEAIELLTAASKKRRDARLDQRLVDVRFDAFRNTEWGNDRPSVPDACADLFPGAGIPEITVGELNVERVRSGILNHGCLLVRGFAPRDRVDLLVGDIDRALAAYDEWAGGADLATTAPWFVPFPQEPGPVERKFRRVVGSVLAVDCPPALFDVIETFEDAGVGRLVGEYFGEPPALLAKKWTLRRVSHEAGQSDWHQDGAFMGGDIRSLNVWLALSHCGDDAPGLDIVARRLDGVVQTGSHGAHLTWTVGPRLVEEVADGSVTRPIFEPGDALIFDHLNLHRTAVDAGMTRDRHAIEAWFLAPSTYRSMIETHTDERGQPPADQLPLVY